MEQLKKYKQKGSFISYPLEKPKDCFKECNAPTCASGIYLIYGLKNDIEELVYIGISGHFKKGVFKDRQDGIRGRLIKGKYKFTMSGRKVTRYIFWKEQMILEGFDRLKIDWFVTHDGTEVFDPPKPIEDRLTRLFKPRWDRITRS